MGFGALALVVFICCHGPEPWYFVLIPIEVAALCCAAAKSELWNLFELFLVCDVFGLATAEPVSPPFGLWPCF